MYPKPNFYEVRFPVSLMRQNSNYPRDVVDALMLAVKETAHDSELDCFVEVFCLTLKTFIKVTVNSIYTGIFGAPLGPPVQAKKKKNGQPVTYCNRKVFLMDLVQKKRPSIHQKSRQFWLRKVDKNRFFYNPISRLACNVICKRGWMYLLPWRVTDMPHIPHIPT